MADTKAPAAPMTPVDPLAASPLILNFEVGTPFGAIFGAFQAVGRQLGARVNKGELLQWKDRESDPLLSVVAFVRRIDEYLAVALPLYRACLAVSLKKEDDSSGNTAPTADAKDKIIDDDPHNWLYNVFYRHTAKGLGNWMCRVTITRQVCWSVPGAGCVAALVHLIRSRSCSCHILDLGAGRGYWSYLFHKYGADRVMALDDYSSILGREEPSSTKAVRCHAMDNPHDYTWYPVTRCDNVVQHLQDHADDLSSFALFVSWATGSVDNWVRAFTGKMIVIVGESEGGCTGSLDIATLCKIHPDKGWTQLADTSMSSHIQVRRWEGMNDGLLVFVRP
jgi:hypothetical protein